MTSVQQTTALPAANAINAAQSGSAFPLSVSGKTSPLAAVPARSYANATRKPASPSPSVVSSSTPSVAIGGPTLSQHGKSNSVSPVNGKSQNQIQPAVPAVVAPTIANSSSMVNGPPLSGEHNRKQSVTINAHGATGHLPNGGPVGGSAGIPNIHFGSMEGSPHIAHSIPFHSQASSLAAPLRDPRVTSPTSSPSPIPQPAVTGGRPPSGLHGQGNGMTFGSLGENGDSNIRTHSLSQTQGPIPLGQPPHMRRESSQSMHGDGSNPAFSHGPHRGGYASNGARGGRAYNQQYSNPQMGFSPHQSYRNLPIHQSRGGPGMVPQFQGPYTNSPRGAPRSPVPMNPQPAVSQMPNTYMQHPHGGYLQHLGPQQVYTISPSYQRRTSEPGTASSTNKSSQNDAASAVTVSQQRPQNTPFYLVTPDLSPQGGLFDQYLTNLRKQGQYAMHPQYDQNFAPFYPQSYGMHPSMYHMGPPPSPRPSYHQTPQAAQYIPGQYGMPGAGQSMSRTPSQVSERPASALGPSSTPLPSNSQMSHQPNQAAGAQSTNANFQIPPRQKKKSSAIAITNDKGEVLNFDKRSISPALAQPIAPVIVASTPTPTPPPQPRSSSVVDVPHNRSDSKGVKSDEDIKRDFQEQLKRQLEAEKLEEKRKADEEATQTAAKAREEAEAKAAIEKAEAEQEAAKEKEESDRIAKEKDEAEKIAKEKDEAERIAKEKAEAERIAKEKAEAERVAKEKEEAERAAKEKDDAERIAKEKEDADRIAEEKKDADRIAREKEDAEKAVKEREDAAKVEAEAKADALPAADDAKSTELKAEGEAEAKAQPDGDEEDRLEREIAEMEAREREEEEREKAYQEKKKKEAEAKAAREAAQPTDEDLKRAEREAEEAEAAREQQKPVEEDSEETRAETQSLFASLKKPTLGPGATQPSDDGTITPASEDSAPAPPAVSGSTAKPKPSALKLDTAKPVEPAQPTPGMQALKSARFIQLQNEGVNYPEGVKSPNPALNQGGKRTGRQYDKTFLLQFKDVFKEKPSPDWDAKLKATVGDSSDTPAPKSVRSSGGGLGPRQPSNRGAVAPFGGVMGTFGQPNRLPPGTTSNERFAASFAAPPRPTMSNPVAPFARPPGGFPVGGQMPLARTNSSQAMSTGGAHAPRMGAGSQRGKGVSRRGALDKAPSRREEEQMARSMPLTAGQDLKPLEPSKSGWKPSSIGVTATAGNTDPCGHMPPDMVQRKVKSALNKMTPEKFDKISDQVLEIAAQSKNETDGRTMRQVIQLTFEKACDEAHWASMYARFCTRMLESMSMDIRDENVKDKAGNPVVGGALFRKYLLNRCQEEFERGWEVNLPDKKEGDAEEAVMLSDEYYVAEAAKRRGLGLIQFIGELYKLGMLKTVIMHQCFMRLLNFEGTPDETAIESLTRLLRTVGSSMDRDEKGHSMMNAYFERILKLVDLPDLPSRMRYMLMDVIDLRKNSWRSKDDAKGPKTIQEIREEAFIQQQQAEAERARQNQRGGPGGRPPQGRGDIRGPSYGMPPPDYNKNQVASDDLRKLGNRATSRQSSSNTGTLGPSSMMASRSSSGRNRLTPSVAARTTEMSAASSRTGTPPVQTQDAKPSTNAFSALATLGDGTSEQPDASNAPSPPTSPPTNKSDPVTPAVNEKAADGAESREEVAA